MQPLEKVTIPVHDPELRMFLWRVFITSMQPYGPAQIYLVALIKFEKRLIENTGDTFWWQVVSLLQEWETMHRHTEGCALCAEAAAQFGIVYDQPQIDTQELPGPTGGGLGIRIS